MEDGPSSDTRALLVSNVASEILKLANKSVFLDLEASTGIESYAVIWVTRPDQAARFAVSFAATPSVKVTPSMTKGN